MGICGEEGLKLELPKKEYLIEATYLSSPRYNILPAAVNFCPGEEARECYPLEITRFSEDVYRLRFHPRYHSISGYLEPKSQVSFRQGGLYHTATLLYDGIYYIEIECSDCLFKRRIDAELENARIAAETIGGNSLLALYGDLEGKKYCLFIGYDDDYKVLLEERADKAAIEGGHLLLVKEHVNMLRHREEAKYSFDGKKFTLAERKIVPQKKLLKKERLLPWYFLECVLAKDFDTALTLLSKENYEGIEAVQLENFFGDFDEVLQNIYDERYASLVGVREKISPCYSKVAYYRFDIRNGFIENILSAR